MYRILLFTALCFGQFTCPPASHAGDRPDAFPRIIFGTRVSARNSPIVQVRESAGGESSLCTGTLITSRVVLTAWHCVSERASAMSVIVNGRRVRVRKVIIHPLASIDNENGVLYNDVALLRLSEKVSITPVKLAQSHPVQVGDLLTISGFGLTEEGFAGSLREGFTQVDGITESFLVTVFQLQESNSCSGDSGGPAMISFRGADGKVKTGIVGITSTGTNTRCTLGDQTNYINLQTPIVADFIRRNAPNVKLS